MNPLRTHLAHTGETAAAFAERIGISPSYLSRLMSGEREADVSVLVQIEEATDGAVSTGDWASWWRTLSAA